MKGKSMMFDATLGLLGPGSRPRMAKAAVLAGIEGWLSAIVQGSLVLVVYQLAAGRFDAAALAKVLCMIGGALVLRFFASSRAMLECQVRGAAFIRDARMAIGEHLRRVPLGFFQRHRPGDLTSRLMTNVQDVESVLTHQYTEIVSAAISSVLIAATLFFIDWRLALVAVCVVPLGLPTIWLTNAFFKVVGRKKFATAGRLNDAFVEFLTGIRTLKAHDLAVEKLDSLKGAIDDSMRMSIKLEAGLAPIILGFQIFLDVGLCATLLLGVRLLAGGTLGVADFTIGAMLAFYFYKPLKAVSQLQAEYRNAEQAASTIRGILDEPAQDWKNVAFSPVDASLEFDRVTFSYDGKKDAVRDLSFSVPSGSVVALVGASGSGKTTAANLAMRLWDPRSGSVRFSGRDVSTVRPEDLLSRMGVVFQDVYLFNDTVRSNIAIAKEGATDDEIEAAAKAAKAHDFIMGLPQGYETVLAEGGASLSGGEKQRIAIARCILKDAPFIILDEATASLDPENERDIQEALARLLAGRTVLVIAHRLKTVRAADRIVVLDGGRKVEEGTHEELSAAGGAYARMWENQDRSAGWSLKRRGA